MQKVINEVKVFLQRDSNAQPIIFIPPTLLIEASKAK